MRNNQRMGLLKQKRNDLGLTLLDAAKDLDTDPGNLSRIENGWQYPSIHLARRLCVRYQISLETAFADGPDQAA